MTTNESITTAPAIDTAPQRKPFAEPLLTEQGDLSEVTAAGFGDMSP